MLYTVYAHVTDQLEVALGNKEFEHCGFNKLASLAQRWHTFMNSPLRSAETQRRGRTEARELALDLDLVLLRERPVFFFVTVHLDLS